MRTNESSKLVFCQTAYQLGSFQYKLNQIPLVNINCNTLVESVMEDSVEANFEELFKTYFKVLHSYAYIFVKDELVAEEIVQNLFMKLWEKKSDLEIHSSIKAFLYRSVYNESLNYLKHQKVKLKYQEHQIYIMKDESDDISTSRVHLKELETRIHETLNKLPEGCRTVFQLSRFEELKYREIADRLNISIKTVENQMGKALKRLRIELIDFLPLLFLLINLK